jgi:hypothetical protein
MYTAWLCARQNADGGWGYSGNASAVEPTVEALLALTASGEFSTPAFHRGVNWISGTQRPDGGWPPVSNVGLSTWVTAMVLLLPASALAEHRRRAATEWLLSETGRESSFVERLRTILLGSPLDSDVWNDGWPWFPGAAAWTMPTAVAVMALKRTANGSPSPVVKRRIRAGQDFLLARRCEDGGWNHGSNHALGYQASSYPETTGIALLALRGVAAKTLQPSLDTAEKHLAATRSREAASWLQLGLLAHGRAPQPRAFDREPVNTPEGALSMLASAALDGKNVLIP